jgi:quinol monooxygenase YgiN
MICHIVMFKLKNNIGSDIKKNKLAELKQMLEKLPEYIQEIEFFEVGTNIAESPNAYDMVLYSKFKDEAALDAYRIHPKHKEVLAFLKKINDKITVVDYKL